MLGSTGTEEPVSVGVGDGEGGLAGASITESVATGGGNSGGAGGNVVGSDAVGGIGERSSEDGESNGGEAVQDRGERTISLSTSGPRNSSAS
jgi:hypothetical protein